MRIQDEPDSRWFKNSEITDIARINFGCGIVFGLLTGVSLTITILYWLGAL